MAVAIARRRFLLPGDGTTRKSIVHASTVAGAVVAALAKATAGVFVVADRVAPSMRELADALASSLGRASPPSVPIPMVLAAAAAPEAMSRLRGRAPAVSSQLIRKSLTPTVCSPAKLEATFGIECRVDLATALEDEVRWLRSGGLL
jgi:nucleoside-diphosphate-sugar epimerase